jgi:hypothetical protein
MNKIYTNLLLVVFLLRVTTSITAQTVVPNGSFETWLNYGTYQNPQYWDTPNSETDTIPFFGTAVVTRSTDHEDSIYSARLETKHILIIPLNIPGFITLGKLTVDLANFSYTITGGVPINDNPTHLQGFYKYLPKGGDSCLIGIALYKTIGNVADTIGYGYFSTHDSVGDWTPFSAWINYDTVAIPDTMNIIALSSAQDTATAGTVLYVDNISLDYTVGVDSRNPEAGIKIYQDKGTKRLLLFFDFNADQQTSAALYNMSGQIVRSTPARIVRKQKQEISYTDLSPGVYVLEIIHDNQKMTKKFILNF